MDLILYHNNCPDGFCAALVAKYRYPDAELVGMNHGNPPPFELVTGKDVIVVDFSWRTRGDNIKLAMLAKSFHIYDHHKTAIEQLDGLDFVTFDLKRSGAGIAWDYLIGMHNVGLTRPWYVNYVEDRDLWRHQLPNTKEINAYIMTLPFTHEAWSILDFMTPDEAATRGAGALDHVNHYVREVVDHKQYGTYVDPIIHSDNGQVTYQRAYTLAIVNAPYLNISEVGNVLATDYADIGVGWFERGDGRVQFSLRSNGDIDVSRIAVRFGGGGHKNAAGFQLSVEQSRDFLDTVLGRKPQSERELFQYECMPQLQ